MLWLIKVSLVHDNAVAHTATHCLLCYPGHTHNNSLLSSPTCTTKIPKVVMAGIFSAAAATPALGNSAPSSRALNRAKGR